MQILHQPNPVTYILLTHLSAVDMMISAAFQQNFERYIVMETPTLRVIMNGTLISSAMNISQAMSATEILVGLVTGKLRKSEHLKASYAATIA